MKMQALDAIEKTGSLDIFGLLSELPKYFVNLYKTNKDKKESEVKRFVSTAVALAADLKYHSFKVYGPENVQGFYKHIEDILLELNIKDIKDITNGYMFSKFISKFRESDIITIKAVNGDGSSADTDQFYTEFEHKLRIILNEKIYENNIVYKELLMSLEIAVANDTDDIKEKIDSIYKLLLEMRDKLQEAIENEEKNKKSSRIIAISMGEYDKNDYEFSLDLREYFTKRSINNKEDWNKIKEDIYEFSQKLKKEAHIELPYILYLSAHMSIAYCLGVCLNGKGNYGVNMMQNTQGKPLNWSIDANRSREEFADKLFNIESHLVNEENNDVAVCISTLANSIYEDTYEFIKANDMPVKRIIDFNLGDNGGNRSVDGGTHGWYLANQVRDEIMRRSFKERKGKLHLFIATPVSIPFFLGQLSFAFKNIVLYEHTTKTDEKDLYDASIFIENADAIS